MGGEDGEWLKGIGVGSEAWCGGWGRALGFVDLWRFFQLLAIFLDIQFTTAFFPPTGKGVRLFYSNRDHCHYWGISGILNMK